MSLLPWHERSWRRLEETRSLGRLAHALLIRGREGWGEARFANQLALSLLDFSVPEPAPEPIAEPDADPADGVESLAARTLAHPDLRWVEPDGAVVKVEQIRAVNEFATGTVQSAPCKVVVIEQAHLMNVNAANALLKTLEEPPPSTYLLLTTSQPGRLLPTIVSRCQTVLLEADEAQSRAWLDTRWPADAVAALLPEYGHAPLAVHGALGRGEAPLLPQLEALARADHPTAAAVALLEHEPVLLLDRWYRCCIALLSGDADAVWASGTRSSAMGRFADELLQTRRQILFSNSANARLLLERLALRWQQLCRAQSVRS